VLLIACATATNLGLARAADGMRELLTRRALGASRARLARQLLAESLLLGALAAGVGVLFAGAGLALVSAFEPGRLPRLEDSGLDLRVLAYAAAAALAAAVLSGAVTALSAVAAAEASPLSDSVRAGGPRPSRLRRGLVVVQLALSLVVLCGAGLLLRSFAGLQAIDPGFDPRGRLTVRLSLPDVHYRYRDQGAKITAFYRGLDERLRALPGVGAVGATTAPPLSGAAVRSRPYAWRGADGESEWGRVSADYNTVTPGWFEAAGVRLLAGRFLDAGDVRERPLAVVVDEALARRAWPGGLAAAVGEPIRVEVFRDGEFQPLWGEVVGVAGSVRQRRLEAAGPEQVYLAHAQSPQRTMFPTLRAAGDPLALVPGIQAAVSELEPELPVFDVRLATEHVADAAAVARFALVTLSAFAAAAVLLAAAGVYALVAHAAARRRHEIGVRLALGATPRRIVRLVLWQGLALAAAGVAGGLALAFAATRALAGLLYGVSPHDPWTLAAASLLLVLVSLVAAWAPARRAARLAPGEALRSA